MAISFTYTTLKAALVSETEETGAEYAAYLDTIIPLAEIRVLKDLDLELFDVSSTSTFTSSSPWLDKPTDLVGLRTMHYTDGSGNYVLIEPRSWAFVKDYWPNASTTTATPKYYAEYASDNWFIAGTPASALVVTIRYIKRPTGLTSGNATTWLGTNVADLLFWACMVESEQYLKADERIGLWNQRYADALKSALKELKPSERVDYTPIDTVP